MRNGELNMSISRPKRRRRPNAMRLSLPHRPRRRYDRKPATVLNAIIAGDSANVKLPTCGRSHGSTRLGKEVFSAPPAMPLPNSGCKP